MLISMGKKEYGDYMGGDYLYWDSVDVWTKDSRSSDYPVHTREQLIEAYMNTLPAGFPFHANYAYIAHCKQDLTAIFRFLKNCGFEKRTSYDGQEFPRSGYRYLRLDMSAKEMLSGRYSTDVLGKIIIPADIFLQKYVKKLAGNIKRTVSLDQVVGDVDAMKSQNREILRRIASSSL
jgi:hypothetical protein